MKIAKKSGNTKGVERRPAQQKRSARTEDKLLNAASRVLNRAGLHRATVPGIAAEARLSPASIYRRFADKDDLLRATLLRMLETSNARNTEYLRTELGRGTLAETAEALITRLIRQYREHPQLLRALSRIFETERESTFTNLARSLLTANLTQAADLLLLHREAIRHPEPELAVRFAVLAATGAIELAALDQPSPWQGAFPLQEKALAAELTRAMVAYLRRKP